jgi:hypothetical protein
MPCSFFRSFLISHRIHLPTCKLLRLLVVSTHQPANNTTPFINCILATPILLTPQGKKPSPFILQGLHSLFCPSPRQPFCCFSCHAFCVSALAAHLYLCFAAGATQIPNTKALPNPTKQKDTPG